MELLSSVIALIFAVTVHEYSHAWMGNRLGDPTARVLGRLSLNPLRHFDIVGTLSLIFFGIGWGKPVPFNPENLRHPKRDSALIALAGPLSNLTTAIVFAMPLHYLSGTSLQQVPVYMLMGHIFMMSILLFSLNVLPLPPFDGSKIIGVFVPHRLQPAYERFLRDGVNYVILFVLFDVLILQKLFGFSILHFLVTKISGFVLLIISLGT